jgi:uncharacterized protein YcbX
LPVEHIENLKQEIKVERITLYPIKSLDGVNVESATVLQSGPLKLDREFALFDSEGNCVNGKRDWRINLIRSRYDLNNKTVFVQSPHQEWCQFHLDFERDDLAKWLSDFLGSHVEVRSDVERAFPDDHYSSGPTIISRGSLSEIGNWYPKLGVEEIRRRFRTNIELDAPVPFWEDRLFGPRGKDVAFKIGTSRFYGTGPCKRCVVPTRDSLSGCADTGFTELFCQKRRETFPAWVNRARFGPILFRVAINTRVAHSEDMTIRLGDSIEILPIE